MLTLLTLVDFQAHEKSVLEFSNGINIIIGESDKGKSSIIRALDFVIQNNVEDYTRHGTKLVAVELDGITRVKSKARNEYHVHGEILKAFGNEPPQDVLDEFKMDNYLNWSFQHDSIFMFSETGGEVARKLNKLVDLDIIITSQTNVNADIKKLNTTSKFNQMEIKNLEKTIEEYMFLPELTRLQMNFQLLLNIENDIKSKMDTIEELKIKAGLNHVSKLRLSKILNLSGKIDYLFDISNINQKTDCRLKVLKRYDTQHKTNIKKQIKYEGIMKLKDKINRIDEICSKCIELESELNNIRHMQRSFITSKADYSALMTQLESCKAKIPKNCPTCGGVLWSL